MIRAVVLLINLSLMLRCSSEAAQLREKRHAGEHPPEITVTLKIEWNATEVGKPIPSDSTTKVRNGTVLISILHKVANENDRSPFKRYDSTYHKGLGYSVTAVDGVKQNHSTYTYWLIVDGQNGGGIACGMSFYVPVDQSTTIFRFTNDFSSHSGTVSGYCKTPAPSSNQIPSPITVTIGLEWNVSTIGKPIPAPYTTQVTQGTVLVDILNKAADEANDSPFNRYQCTYTAGLGRAITAMNGVAQDPENHMNWMIYDNKTGKYISLGVDQYKPGADSVTVFRLGKPDEETVESSGHRSVGMKALVLHALIAIGGLLV